MQSREPRVDFAVEATGEKGHRGGADQAMEIASSLRNSAEPSRRAVGEFVTHGLLSAIHAAEGEASWIDELPMLAHGLAMLGFRLGFDKDLREISAPVGILVQLMSLELPGRAPVARPRRRAAAKAALRDWRLMLDLAEGAELPTAEDVDSAFEEGVAAARVSRDVL